MFLKAIMLVALVSHSHVMYDEFICALAHADAGNELVPEPGMIFHAVQF